MLVHLQVIEFLRSLLLDFDFEGAQVKLAEVNFSDQSLVPLFKLIHASLQVESVIVTDFFLSRLTTPREFLDAARLFIFETYCRIHQTIDLRWVAMRWLWLRSSWTS